MTKDTNLKDHLKLFKEKTKILENTSFIKKRVKNLSVNIVYKKGQGLRTDSKYPKDDDLILFLVAFRHFYMNDSEVSFNYICNELYKIAVKEEVKKNISLIRKYYNNSLNNAPIRFQYNDKLLKPKDIIDLYLYGEHFHTNLEFREILKGIKSSMDVFFQFLFVTSLYDLARSIISLNRLIDEEFSEYLSD